MLGSTGDFESVSETEEMDEVLLREEEVVTVAGDDSGLRKSEVELRSLSGSEMKVLLEDVLLKE